MALLFARPAKRQVLRAFLNRQFAVDEKPVPVYLSDEQDLAALVSDALRENDRLTDLNTQLQQRQATPVEMDKFIRSLLPTLDSFDRVLNLARSHPPSEEVDNWLKSIESIYFRMVNLLESYELFQLKTIGKTVDLNLHEVVEYRRSEEHPPDTVISERQKGYVFRNKLLRDAKVVVAYNDGR